MKCDTIRVLQESNRIGIEFLRTELEAGHTFLDIADTSDCEITRMRTLRNAWRAHDLVLRMVSRLELSLADNDELLGKLHGLKRRLDSRT